MTQISSQFRSQDILLKDLNNLMSSFTSDTFTPIETNITKSGTIIVSAVYQQIGKLCFFIIDYIPGSNTITIGANATIKLPISPARNPAYTSLYRTNNCTVYNATTDTVIGTAVIDTTNKVIKLPTLPATTNEVTISGYYWTN